MAMTVLLGTLYPLLVDALGGGKISVGPPYFNAVFVPIMSLMAIGLGISVTVRWRDTPLDRIIKAIWKPALASILIGAVFPFIYGSGFNFSVFLGIAISLWILLTISLEFISKFKHADSIFTKLKQLSMSYYGMMLAHAGVAVVAIGITLVSVYSEERDIRMVAGDKVTVAGYEFEFKGVQKVQGANYTADRGQIIVRDGKNVISTLNPEKRHYSVKNNMMTEADIDQGFFRDLFVAMGEPLDGDAWAIRIHYKPFVRWLWYGGTLMALGGLVTVADKRYRRKKTIPATNEASHA